MKNEGVSGARIKIAGQEVATDALHALSIESEMDLPDMAVITLNNTEEYGYSHNTAFGATVEVEIGATAAEAKSVFKGEMVALEPAWRDNGESQVTIRAFNRLHRLTRGKKSRTFVKMTDKDIVSKVAQDWGLSAECKGDINTKYDHIYQHNQSDFEFLKVRAARINYELRVDDTKLFFSQRKPEGDEIELKWGSKNSDASLQRFSARLNTGVAVKEVRVRGWNPDKHEEIIGIATTTTTKLGKSDVWGDAGQKFGGEPVWFDVDIPVTDKGVAEAIAKAKLEELRLSYITGEGQAKGNPDLKPGGMVKIVTGDSRFDGKYQLVGVSHQYSHKAGSTSGGYRTLFKVRRNSND